MSEGERWTIFEARRSGRRRRRRPTTWPTVADRVARGSEGRRACPTPPTRYFVSGGVAPPPPGPAEAVAALHHLGAVSPCT